MRVMKMAAVLLHLECHLKGLACQFTTHHSRLMLTEIRRQQDKCNKTTAILVSSSPTEMYRINRDHFRYLDIDAMRLKINSAYHICPAIKKD